MTEMEFLNRNYFGSQRGAIAPAGRVGLRLKFHQQDSLRSIESNYSLAEDPKSTESESKIWIWQNRERRHIMKCAVGFSFDNP